MTQDSHPSEQLPTTRGLGRAVGLPLGAIASLALLWFGDLEPGRPEVTATAAIALLMGIWWITEALPLPTTSLLPVVLFPLLGVLNGKAVATQYFNHIIFLFIGGFVIALAMQRWNLHRRIALRMLLLFGAQPRRILLGFMVTNAFLSMWISNTAATMMMVTIALALIVQIEESNPGRAARRFSVGLLLGVAYSASIGGVATLVGTPPNLSFTRIFEIQFPNAPEISFANWFAFGAPITLVLLSLTWVLLTLLYVPSKGTLAIERDLISKQYAELGKLRFAETVVLIAFVSLVVLWLTRSDIQIGGVTLPGWSSLFEHPSFFNDGTVAVAVALFLYAIPSLDGKGGRIMDWETTARLPWNIVLLFGGGFALAYGFAESGLASWLGEKLSGASSLSTFLLLAVLCLSISFLTELTSNTATTEMILPVMAGLGMAIDVNPLLLMIPVTISCSCAFMMPVATPPNAIVFGSGKLSIAQMARTGVLLNVLGMLVIVFMTWLLAGPVFGIDLGEMPAWATGR